MLSVSALSASYGAIRAVNGISFEAPEGRLVAVLGANGAGKSTTLRSIGGLHRPVAGTITLDGRDISTLPVHRVVRSGLAKDDVIVVDGLLRARPGATVKPEQGKIEFPSDPEN